MPEKGLKASSGVCSWRSPKTAFLEVIQERIPGMFPGTQTGKFFETCSVISSHEDEKAWASIYKFIQGCGINPRYNMGDGVKAMCWSHVHHNIVPRLKSIATIDKSLSEKILLNIMDIQWSSLNEAIFLKMF